MNRASWRQEAVCLCFTNQLVCDSLYRSMPGRKEALATKKGSADITDLLPGEWIIFLYSQQVKFYFVQYFLFFITKYLQNHKQI